MQVNTNYLKSGIEHIFTWVSHLCEQGQTGMQLPCITIAIILQLVDNPQFASYAYIKYALVC